MGRTAEDLTGKRFGRLVVLRRSEKRCGASLKWLCQCDCGNIVDVIGSNLRGGRTESCGCLRSETSIGRHKTHGLSRSSKKDNRIYRIWCGMKERCLNRNFKYWHRYGGSGIDICDEWKNDYMAFHNWAIENGYKDDLTIDRIDNQRGYEPSNCRWATYEQQLKNRRNSVFVMYNGEKKTVGEVARIEGISWDTAKRRFM